MTATPVPTISVLVVARDAAATIGEQLDALLAQEYATPWELVVVDDGPTRSTRSRRTPRLQEWAKGRRPTNDPGPRVMARPRVPRTHSGFSRSISSAPATRSAS
ncbi:MAG: glycosyltransferase, partial [Actinomycetota bacterium]